MLSFIFLGCILVFVFGYKVYGKFLSRMFGVSDRHKTPAHLKEDGVDYVPTSPLIVFGHHFASIAGAGPIVGPILACTYFGWLPVLVWILVGSIFIGGLHDFLALLSSIRNEGKSIAEIAKRFMGKEMYYITLIFILVTIEYVLVVFADLTATTFVSNGSVATSAFGYILIALVFGFILYKYKPNLIMSSIPFVILLFVILYLGYKMPIASISLFGLDIKETWQVIILIYCFIASILPVWLLLQPRDYLSSFLLYFALLVGIIGLVFIRNPINFPMFIPPTLRSGAGITIFPVLFITVACGAVSGFHSLVASGTSAKQVDRESDTKVVGYGSMLVEGLVAVIALATVMMLSRETASSLGNPLVIFSNGIGKFLNIFGLKPDFANMIGLLIISTFLLTTLDTGTRIARYVFDELFDIKSKKARLYSTVIVLIMPLVFAFLKIKDPATGAVIPAWKAIWPVFAATNQLMAVLAFIVLIKQFKERFLFIKIPALFMLSVTGYALLTYIFNAPLLLIKITSALLLLISVRAVMLYFK